MNDQDKSELDALLVKIKDAVREQVKSETSDLKKLLVAQDDILVTQGATLKKLTENRFDPSDNTGNELKAFLSTQKDKFSDMASGRTSNLKIKIPGDVVKALVLTSSITDSTRALRLGNVGQVATAKNVIRSLFSQGILPDGQGGSLRYLDQVASEITRGADFTAEGEIKNESAIEWIEKVVFLKKVTDSLPLTRESLSDFAWMLQEVQNFLLKNLSMKVDEALYDGDGISENLLGLLPQISEFVYDGPAIQSPNLYDLAMTVRSAILAEGGSKFNPTVSLVNPGDAVAIKLLKDTLDRYVLGDNPTATGGIRFVESSQVEANTMIVGDFGAATVYSNGIDIDLGYTGDQFVRNRVTMLCEERLLLLLRTVDVPAFRKVSDVVATLALLESGGGS